MDYATMHSPLGSIRIARNEEGITEVEFVSGKGPPPPEHWTPNVFSLSNAIKQLQEYFAGERTRFDLPLAPRGTSFQLSVWDALRDIPYGETRSYADIARRIGRERATRAVGAANGRNPVAIIIPCHRVIGSSGSLTGYAGGLELKRALLRLEATNSNLQSRASTG